MWKDNGLVKYCVYFVAFIATLLLSGFEIINGWCLSVLVITDVRKKA